MYEDTVEADSVWETHATAARGCCGRSPSPTALLSDFQCHHSGRYWFVWKGRKRCDVSVAFNKKPEIWPSLNSFNDQFRWTRKQNQLENSEVNTRKIPPPQKTQPLWGHEGPPDEAPLSSSHWALCLTWFHRDGMTFHLKWNTQKLVFFSCSTLRRHNSTDVSTLKVQSVGSAQQ